MPDNTVHHHHSSSRMDWLDRFAVGASVLCMVHCLALPLVFALLPTLASVMPVPEVFHFAILALAVPTSAMALLSGQRRHGSVWPVVVGTIGLVMLAIGVLAFGETKWETPITVSGSLLLVAAHFANFRLRAATI